MSRVQIGMKVKDRITGFTGIVTGFTTYITGCSQFLVAPPVKDDGSFVDSMWFDEQRLEIIDKQRVVLDNSVTVGPDKSAPVR